MVSASLKKVSSSQKLWETVGPANKRCCDLLQLVLEDEPDNTELLECQRIIASCKEFLNSDAMFLLLSNITGLNLHPLASVDNEENSENEGDSLNDMPNQTMNANIKKLQSNLNTKEGVLNSTNSKVTISEPVDIDSTSIEELKCHSKSIATVRRWRQVNLLRARLKANRQGQNRGMGIISETNIAYLSF